MYIASYFEYNPQTRGGTLVHEECSDGRIKPFIDKLQERANSKEIKNCIIWQTQTFIRIEKK